MELFLPSPDVSYATREGTITGSLAVVVFHNWLNHRLSKSPYCVKSRLSHASRSFLRLCMSLIKIDLWAIVDSVTDALVQQKSNKVYDHKLKSTNKRIRELS